MLCLQNNQRKQRQFWKVSFCHKLKFSDPYFFGTRCHRPLIFQAMNSVQQIGQSLKYQMFGTMGSKGIGERNCGKSSVSL